MRKVMTEMETLLETLLMLAREENVLENDATTSVNQVLFEELEKLRELAEQNGNAIDLKEDAEVTCRAKPRVLAIIISNLLRNALTYTRNGRVTIRIAPNYFEIEDTGIGMEQSEREQAFTAFYRGERSRHQVSGQGLGLALVRRLTDQLDWTVELHSRPDVGTTVRVYFTA